MSGHLSPHFHGGHASIRAQGVAARFANHAWTDKGAIWEPSPGHRSLTEARTLYPASTVHSAAAPRVLVSGQNQRKIGRSVSKGPWRGAMIYCLTLEERATCPRSCHHWASCYGNGMPLARRHSHGPELLSALRRELPALHDQHRRGIAVRLHILGDFFSVSYVEFWSQQLDRLPKLRVFGFTAHRRGSGIGDAVDMMNRLFPGQAAIRFSHVEPGSNRAVTIDRPEQRPEGAIICPAQTGATAGCGSCGLCWTPGAEHRTIAFLRHGRAA